MDRKQNQIASLEEKQRQAAAALGDVDSQLDSLQADIRDLLSLVDIPYEQSASHAVYTYLGDGAIEVKVSDSAPPEVIGFWEQLTEKNK
jgi:hypothetical protein